MSNNTLGTGYTQLEKYRAHIEDASKRTGVDANLIAAVIMQESRGDSNATSPVGARGLMQLMPDTWTEVESNYSLGRSTNHFDPQANILRGSYYLAEKLGEFDGNVDLGLAAYNAGAGTVQAANGKISALPSETRAYIPGVKNHYATVSGGDAPSGYTSLPAKDAKGSTTNTPDGILKFANFVQSLAFVQTMRAGFEQQMERSLHDYLSQFMVKFYHNLLYIPTLPNNKAILVKPETLFIDPPSCNVIYPSFKTGTSFTRSYKSEPTRILQTSDAMGQLFGAQDKSLYNLVTIAYIDYEDATQTKQVVRGFKEIAGDLAGDDFLVPMGLISKYEEENGVRILRSNSGSDLYLFLLSDTPEKDAKGLVLNTSASGTDNLEKIGETLFKLAKYQLLRSRYEQRPGSVQMYFNPYMVPGLPMLNIESPNESELNIWGYVTDVVHQITERGWNSHASYTATHIDAKDPRPNAFPIIEEEYVSDLSSTYADMLGPAVTPIKTSEAPRNKYANSEGTVSEAYQEIWRPLTTMQEYLEDIADGAVLTDVGGYYALRGTFFKNTTQNRVESYVKQILEGKAFNIGDVD